MATVSKAALVAVAVVAVGGLGWYFFRGGEEAPPLSRDLSPVAVTPKAEATPPRVVPSELGAWSQENRSSAEDRFLTLRARAESGDMVAQRDLGELYQRCAIFSLSPSNMYSMLDAYALARGKPVGTYDSIKKRFAAACSGVDNGAVIPREAYTSWFEQAAGKGDPYSKVTLATKNWSTLKPDDFQQIARDVINSSDPEAIFVLGDLVALAPEGTDLGELKAATEGPYANYAWGIAACRMGADCGPNSFRMDSLCINTGICGAGSFEDAIRDGAVPAAEQEALDKAISEVEGVVGKRTS